MRVGIITAGLLVALSAAMLGVAGAVRQPVAVPVIVPSAILAGVTAADAKLLRDFHAAMADIVVRDGLSPDPVCKTTFGLRDRYKSALQMAFAHTGMVGKYVGLGDKLDAYLLEAIGKTDSQLTAESRQAAAKAFSSVR
jgi:hypothetical protein